MTKLRVTVQWWQKEKPKDKELCNNNLSIHILFII
jgi:hypothetical protein